MTYRQVYDALQIETAPGVTIPVAYYQFPEDDPNNPAPPPPFICYYYPDSNDLYADDTNYQRIRPLTVELYTGNKDFALENAVEAAMASHGFVFSRSEEYISSERLYMTTYETEVVITNG